MASNRPKIAFLAGTPFAGNENNILFSLGRMLVEEFDLVLVGPSRQIPERLSEYFRVIEVEPARFKFSRLLFYFKEAKAAAALAPDIMINVCKPNTVGLSVSWVGKRAKATTVIRMTGDSFGKAGLKTSLLGWLKTRLVSESLALSAYRNADHVLAISERLRQDLFERALPPERISVLMQPFDTQTFTPPSLLRKEALKKDLGLPGDRLNVLVAGRLTRVKGMDRLGEVVNKVKQEGMAITFWVIGSGPYLEVFQEMEATGAPIHVLGKVPHETISGYYQASDVLGYFSRSEGGVPNVVLEALGTGLPVISFPVADVPLWAPYTVSTPEEFVDACEKIRQLLEQGETPPPGQVVPDWEVQAREYRAFFRRMAAGPVGSG